jgi:uncharacterized membrane protein YfcA
MAEPDRRRRSLLAFLFGVPIAVLGGLIGLGGAEFRLPVLAGPLGYPAKRAVPLNLAVSLVTVAVALLIRAGTLSLTPLAPLVPAILALIVGAVGGAYVGTALTGRLSNAQLERVILVLLLGIGTALIIEGFLPGDVAGLLPPDVAWRVGAGVVFGLGIGLVSSLLGVVGGELIIPTLVFAYGADIKTVGTASLLVNLPSVAVGVLRYARQRAYARAALVGTVMPMSVGSVVGAILGGVLVGVVPAGVLKVGLGLVLIASAWRLFLHQAASRRAME